MFQNILADQVFGPAVADSSFAVPTAVTVPVVKTVAAAVPYKARYVGFINPTLVATDYVGFAVGVSDPQRRGKMVLSYSITVKDLSASTLNLQCAPVVLDRQGVAALGANVNVNVAPAADLAWMVPGAYLDRLSACGRLLVDTSITSATPGITTREFFVGATLLGAAGAHRLLIDLQVYLYADQDPFFQPFK